MYSTCVVVTGGLGIIDVNDINVKKLQKTFEIFVTVETTHLKRQKLL